MREYKKREYCNDIKCKIQVLMNKADEEEYEKLRDVCKTDCIHSTYEFHHWLIDKGFEISKEE